METRKLLRCARGWGHSGRAESGLRRPQRLCGRALVERGHRHSNVGAIEGSGTSTLPFSLWDLKGTWEQGRVAAVGLYADAPGSWHWELEDGRKAVVETANWATNYPAGTGAFAFVDNVTHALINGAETLSPFVLCQYTWTWTRSWPECTHGTVTQQCCQLSEGGWLQGGA